MGVGEELVDVGDAPLRAPLLARHGAQLLDATEGKDDARIAAVQLDHVQIVVAIGEERLIVQRLDVVALHRGLAQHLPVRLVVELDLVEEDVVVRQHLGQVAQSTVRQRLILRHENDAVLLLHRRHRHQPVRRLVETGEAVLARDVAQRAIEPVGPGVIGAGEGALASLALLQLHAAVAAGVAETAHHAVAAAHHQQRRADRRARDVGARLGQRRRRTEGHRHAAQHLDLGREPLGRMIVLDRLAPDCRSFVGLVAVDVREDAIDQVGFVQQRGHSSSSASGRADTMARAFDGATTARKPTPLREFAQ